MAESAKYCLRILVARKCFLAISSLLSLCRLSLPRQRHAATFFFFKRYAADDPPPPPRALTRDSTLNTQP